MSDLSHFGTIAYISASNTIPAPLPITHFADNADGIDLPSMDIADMVMGTNGHVASWSKAVPIEITVNLLPNNISHLTMNTIFEANRPEQGKKPARDIITFTRVLPDGSTLTLSGGKMISGTPATSMASDGRTKNPSYMMKFAKMLYTPSPDALLDL